MENKTIVETIFKQESFHHCARHIIVLSGVLKENIVINFLSSSKTEFRYKINYKTLDRSFEFEGELKYSSPGDLYVDTIKDIEKILLYLEIELSKEDYEKLVKIICKCIDKCKRRADNGSSVLDFHNYWADAVLTIKGVDNGKPKHKITFFNHDWEKINKEDYDVGELIGRSIFVEDVDNKNYAIWLIEKDSISLEDLLIHLMCEFDNPYIMIEPTKEMNIILDFKLKTDKYNVTL